MATFLAGLVVFGLAVLGLAVGVLLQGRRLRGSCGRSGESCLCSPLAAHYCAVRRHRAAQEPAPHERSQDRG